MSSDEAPIPAPEGRREGLHFPCRFPLKAVGNAGAGFREHVVGLVRGHAPGLRDEDVRETPSRSGRFVSITVIIDADSQAQLDAIYLALKADPLVSVLL
jgi:putative lipoic acid-binding regulatory protein